MLPIATQLTAELPLAVVSLLAVVLSTAPAQAQSAFVEPQTNYGGQLVHEMVPYQPDIVYSSPQLDQSPIYLDQCPEFCQPANTLIKDAYANGPVLLEPAAQDDRSQIPPGFRQGLFQKLFFTGTYVPQFQDDSLGVSQLEAGIVFALPFFRVTTPLLITPRFAVNYLDGPAAPDLPARVYDADLTFRHLRKFGDGPWAMNAAITFGYYSDYESSDADAFRITGQAFAVYESSPATTWVFGVVYLNRDDLPIIPAAGVIYEPTPDVKYEAIMPRPRISWRLSGDAIGTGSERWAYLGGEFGSGVWSIERPPTPAMPAFTQDLVTYGDYRLLVGIERKITGGLSRRLEAGYVFVRELEFASATPKVRLDDSLFVRGGLTY